MTFSTFVAQKTIVVIDTIGANLFCRFIADSTQNFRHIVASQQFDFGAARQFAGSEARSKTPTAGSSRRITLYRTGLESHILVIKHNLLRGTPETAKAADWPPFELSMLSPELARREFTARQQRSFSGIESS